MIAKYDLSEDINSHDYYQWLPWAAALGATEIVLDISKGFRRSLWPEKETQERYKTIVKPGAALMGLPCREGTDGERIDASYKLEHLVTFARTHKLPRMRSVLPPKMVRYTVTLRKQTLAHPWRNSDEFVWRRFAKEIGALVIPDYLERPIDLYERFALYAGAEMNFGVDNGPMTVLTMTPYPCMIFKYHKNHKYLTKCGLVAPQVFPWCEPPNQMMFWEDDTADNIRRRFEEWKNGDRADSAAAL